MSGGRLQMTLQAGVLQWARERAGLEPAQLAGKLGIKPERVFEWEKSGRISFSQVDKLAHHTHTPVGFLYLAAPPEDRLTIPDLRTVGDRPLHRPSPDLLETVQMMQRRQAWMREELIEDAMDPLGFVGAFGLNSPHRDVAEAMRGALKLDHDWAAREQSWTDALRHLRKQIEDAGVLVMFNGIVGNNTHRKLNPDEFRGFALVDEYAPLIFINGADFKGAQMFTMAHELAHIFIGAAGVSNFEALQPASHAVEQFCNRVAAEFLVPEAGLREYWARMGRIDEPYQAIARQFKVSTLVAARRALDLGLINRETFFEFYQPYQEDERRLQQRKDKAGGSFWNNQNVRIGYRFGTAIIRAVSEGRLLYRDAYALTGLKGKTFDRFVKNLSSLR